MSLKDRLSHCPLMILATLKLCLQALMLTYPGILGIYGLSKHGLGICINSLAQIMNKSRKGLPIVLAGRKMMAVDYYHVSPLKYDYDYPPSILRENPSAFDLFADSHTVSHIITYDAEWTRFFRSLPDSFEEVYVAHGNSTKLIFRRRNDL